MDKFKKIFLKLVGRFSLRLKSTWIAIFSGILSAGLLNFNLSESQVDTYAGLLAAVIAAICAIWDESNADSK